MPTIPFLTDLDSRAAVKGSRDPLGIQQIWARLGRHVVGNLTTVSNSVRDFTVLLLGYHFAESLSEEIGPGKELSTFLKWEQLAAYARASINKDLIFRGTERVQKNLSEGTRIKLSAGQNGQILANQKIYGLWGLYTVAARASGLLDGDPARPTLPTREIIEKLYLPELQDGAGKAARCIREALKPAEISLDLKGSDKAMLGAVGRVLKPRLRAEERGFYRDYLLLGGPQDSTQGRQRQFVELLEETLNEADFTWSTARLGDFEKKAHQRGTEWHPLAHRLGRIRTAESVLAPVSMLFVHLLGMDGKSIASVVKRLREAWGQGLRTVDASAFEELKGEISADDAMNGTAIAERWCHIAKSLAEGNYSRLIELLVDQNRVVMARRGGASWIEKRDGKLHVRFRDEQGALPKREEIPGLWRFPYFLDSLRGVAATLREI